LLPDEYWSFAAGWTLKQILNLQTKNKRMVSAHKQAKNKYYFIYYDLCLVFQKNPGMDFS